MLKQEALELPRLAGVEVTFTAAGLALSGAIASKEPDKVLGRFFRAVHDQVVASKFEELSVDVRGLTFMNSSAIRLFIDWAIWVSQPSVKTTPTG